MIARALALLFLALGAMRLEAVPNDDQVDARKRALLLAGAFSNDGFKIRDGHWVGDIKVGEARVVQVNLYAGNEYWFSAAATDPAKKLAVNIYDETGAPIKTEPYQDASTAAAGFAPEASGTYFVKVEELEGDPAAFCLLYSYK